ncbi:MAG TPA: site-specific integrase [Thermoleophilia bacterium]|nr:site-specific integrase [Thermoleophilia bacterium]
MGQLHDQMEADLKIGGYSSNTQRVYIFYARKFAAYFMRSPAEMGADEVRRFLLHLVEERCASRETIRQVRSSLRFLYGVTLNRPVEVEWVPVPRKQKRLPVVFSGTEVAELLEAVRRLKYRMILTAMYAAGLRISEACQLQPEDIDSKRMVMRIRGKGDKERYTLLSGRLLLELRDYWRRTEPQGGWLFPGRTRAGHASKETSRKVFHKAIQGTRITKHVTPHTLRHSFATHLIEVGTDVTVVQALLGHASLRATEVYTHTSVEQIARTRSPLDLLGTPAAAILG